MIYIIVPVFNTAKYLSRCLDSIFNQKYQNFHLVIVNDGSTDNSLEIIKTYKKLHKNVSIIDKNNSGPSDARNCGLNFIFTNFKINNNDYITFIDSDDWIDNNYLSSLIKLTNNKNIDIIISSFYLSHSKQDKKIVLSNKEYLLNSEEATCKLLEDRSIQSHSPEKLYRATLWFDIRYPTNIVSMEDQATIYKVFKKASTIMISTYIGYHYWQSSNSICRSEINNKKVLDSLNGYYEPLKDVTLTASEYKSAIQGFSNVYLMMFPRFSNSKASQDEKLLFKQFTKYVYTQKIINQFIPKNRSEKIKKITYLYFYPLYKTLFRIYSKINH